mgnify:CR=1 FL=1
MLFRSGPAAHPAFAAGGDEEDVAVGEAAGLVVVPRAAGDLAEAGAVGLDLVEVVEVGAVGAVGEEDGAAVVIDVGVADAAAFGVEDDGAFLGAEVVAVEDSLVGLAVAGLGLLVDVVAVVADVGVPVAVVVARAGAEDDLGVVFGGAFEGGFEKVGAAGERERPGGEKRGQQSFFREHPLSP